MAETIPVDIHATLSKALSTLAVARADVYHEPEVVPHRASLDSAVETIERVVRDLSLTRLAALTPDRLEQAYRGSADKCACGCSGTWYATGDQSQTERDNAVAIMRSIQRRARKAPASIGYYRYSDGSENWNYQTKSRLFILNTHKPADASE